MAANPNLPELSGGQLVVASLRAHGVEMAFSVAGESYLEVLDALYDAPEIRLVTCRQEGGAAFMAEAYGKLTGKPGVLLVTRGPGACNASIGVHTAHQDSTPVILFIGQVSNEVVERGTVLSWPGALIKRHEQGYCRENCKQKSQAP